MCSRASLKKDKSKQQIEEPQPDTIQPLADMQTPITNNIGVTDNSHPSVQKSTSAKRIRKIKRKRKLFAKKKIKSSKVCCVTSKRPSKAPNIAKVSYNIDDFELVSYQENLQKLQSNQEKLEKINKIVSKYTEYDGILYKSVIYYIGDKLLIYAQDEIAIGELVRIIPKNGNSRYSFWPTIEVKWYYKKSDINRKKNNLIDIKNFNSISEFELFPSEHKDVIWIETLIGKCNIYTYEEYEQLLEHTDNTFFTRANYDHITELFNPRFDDWEKGCMCKRPLNPDQFYIKCDSCNNWFHPKCCGLNQEDTENLETFVCPRCRNEKEKEGKIK